MTKKEWDTLFRKKEEDSKELHKIVKRKVSDKRIKEILNDINDLVHPSLHVPDGTVYVLKRARKLIKDLIK